MDESEKGQVSGSAAEIYDKFFLPALFQEWASRVAVAANVHPGQRVLDVACGTGVLACAVAERVSPGGSVVGLDINEGMLAVAKSKTTEIEWRQGRAEALPFDNASFDAVVSQFGLMFFEDRPAALREMLRVLRPGGRLAVAVWDALEHSPGYLAMTELLRRLFGNEVAAALNAPFVLGDAQRLRALFATAGMAAAQITTQAGTARFPSLQAWVFTDMKGWTLADRLDDVQFAQLLAEAEQVLQPFVGAQGRVAFPVPAHIVTASKAA
jgi:SAM-dependent methyltransferase